MDKTINIAITGAAGNIAYNLIFMMMNELFTTHKINLRLLDITARIQVLQAIKMELEDCAYHSLRDIIITDQAEVAFEAADFIIMLGAFPRFPGMERSDLLLKNAEIFKLQGTLIASYASQTVQVLVVGNPANTNAMIAAHAAHNLPHSAFTALSMLDQNRATYSLAKYLKLTVAEMSNVIIWGNHSSTLVPDPWHALHGQTLLDLEELWVYEQWIPWVQQRGSNIIAQRGLSSAASAARAICDHLKLSLMFNSPIFSLAACSDGEYDSFPGTWISSPHQMQNGKLVKINSWQHSPMMLQLLKRSFDEVTKERDVFLRLS